MKFCAGIDIYIWYNVNGIVKSDSKVKLYWKGFVSKQMRKIVLRRSSYLPTLCLPRHGNRSHTLGSISVLKGR